MQEKRWQANNLWKYLCKGIEMKFKYLDKVVITDGFFAGATGEIIDVDDGFWFTQYHVSLDPHGAVRSIHESQLELNHATTSISE